MKMLKSTFVGIVIESLYLSIIQSVLLDILEMI